ncbi:MAG TPA: cytochrome c [Hyphomicrobiaceae bacterium]|jgi:cytochrome c556|nr:cytochrome c [Hyphomicrobiaceae bacterium]
MLRIVAAVAALAIGATIVYAQNAAVIKERQNTMKSIGDAAEVPAHMVKGEIPFDLAAAQKAFETIEQGATKAKGLFPEDSKTGAETWALPKIWENKADVMNRLDKVIATAKSAQGEIKDKRSLAAALSKLGKACNSCHDAYRRPEN